MPPADDETLMPAPEPPHPQLRERGELVETLDPIVITCPLCDATIEVPMSMRPADYKGRQVAITLTPDLAAITEHITEQHA